MEPLLGFVGDREHVLERAGLSGWQDRPIEGRAW
jgi:hypothetical protein